MARAPAAGTQKPRRGRGRIAIKRVYDDVAPADGMRILIDRLWPRGLSKATLKFDAWPRELAPSNELRRWFGHDPGRYAEFCRRYRDELAGQRDEIGALRATIKMRATLITATRDLELSHANVLREMLEKPRPASRGADPKARRFSSGA